MKRRKPKDIPHRIGPAELQNIVASLGRESDRGAVLISACFIEAQLEALHRAFIESNIGTRSRLFASLFSYPQPLSTFAARIQLGYAYGLIDFEVYQDLEKIRDLRNDCAHQFQDVSFSSPSIRDRALSLKLGHDFMRTRFTDMKPTLDAVARHFHLEEYKPEEHPRIHFLFSCQEAAFRIMERQKRILESEIARFNKHLTSRMQ